MACYVGNPRFVVGRPGGCRNPLRLRPKGSKTCCSSIPSFTRCAPCRLNQSTFEEGRRVSPLRLPKSSKSFFVLRIFLGPTLEAHVCEAPRTSHREVCSERSWFQSPLALGRLMYVVSARSRCLCVNCEAALHSRRGVPTEQPQSGALRFCSRGGMHSAGMHCNTYVPQGPHPSTIMSIL